LGRRDALKGGEIESRQSQEKVKRGLSEKKRINFEFFRGNRSGKTSVSRAVWKRDFLGRSVAGHWKGGEGLDQNLKKLAWGLSLVFLEKENWRRAQEEGNL